MFFYLSKLGGAVTSPGNAAVMACVAGIVLFLSRRSRPGRALTALGVAGLLVFGFSPVPKLMLRPLEERFPPRTDRLRRVDGIVVLGGIGLSRGQISLYDSGSRITAALELAAHNPQATVVFSGGAPALFARGSSTEAASAGRLLDNVGILPGRVILEDRSRNTHENAIFTRRLISPRPGERWLLVTSAFHMPRALACFQAVGLSVEPYPVDFRTNGDSTDYWPFAQVADGLRLANLAVAEWAGLVVYRLAGYTDELLPERPYGGQ